MLTEKDFKKRFEELRDWIRASVTVFDDMSPEARMLRTERGKIDLFYFAKTYFPHYCYDDFAPMHNEMFAVADVYNIPVIIAGARDIAKSVIIAFIDEMHKTLFRLNRFTEFVCNTQETAASEFLLPIRAELEVNQRIINDFGDLRSGRWENFDFVTKSGKRFLALGPRMGVKGKRHGYSRPDRIVVEDLENRNTPKKAPMIRKLIKWILTDLMKSVNTKRWQFIFIGNYDTKKSVLHILLSDDPRFASWIKRIYEACTLSFGEGRGGAVIKSLWPSHLPDAILQKEYDEDPVTFRTERLQKPEDEESTFKEEWFEKCYIKEEDIPPGLPTVTFVDPSALKGEEHCYKAIIVLSLDVKDMTFYIRHAWIRKTSKWAMVRSHFSLSKQFHSIVDGIEANGFQATLKEDYELEEKTTGITIPIKQITQHLNKEVRIGSLASLIERGKLKFMQNDSNQNLLIEQFLDFPDGNLDGPDALEGAKSLAERFIAKITKKVGAKVLG